MHNRRPAATPDSPRRTDPLVPRRTVLGWVGSRRVRSRGPFAARSYFHPAASRLTAEVDDDMGQAAQTLRHESVRWIAMVGVVDSNAMPSKVLIASGGETSTQTVGPTAEQSGAPIALSSSSLSATGLSCHLQSRYTSGTPDNAKRPLTLRDVENPFPQVRGHFGSSPQVANPPELNVVMQDASAVRLEVDALAGGVGGQQDAHRVAGGRSLEGGLEVLTGSGVHPAVQQAERVAPEATGVEQTRQPGLGVAVLGEDDDPLVVPLAVGPAQRHELGDQAFRFAVRRLDPTLRPLLERGQGFGRVW